MLGLFRYCNMTEPSLQEDDVTARSDPHKDRGYAWVVLVAGVFLISLISGSISSYSIMLPEYVDYFRVSKTEAALVMSIADGAAAVGGITSGTLIRLYGIRRMSLAASLITTFGYVTSAFLNSLMGIVVTHGMVIGFANMFHLTSAIVAVPTYFDKKKAFAFSIVTLGFTLGTIVWSPVIQALVDHYGKHGLLVFAGINANGLVASALLRPRPSTRPCGNRETSPRGDRTSCRDCHLSSSSLQKQFSFFRDPVVIIYYVSLFLTISGHIVPYYFLPARVQAFGAAKQQGALLLSVLGIARLVVSPVIGHLGDRLKRHRTAIYSVTALFCGVLGAATCPINSYVPLLVVVCVYGAVSVGFGGLYLTILSDLVPLRQMPLATGLLNTGIDTCQMITGTLSGHLVDVTGSYATPFLVYGCVLATGGCFGLLLYGLQRRQQGDDVIRPSQSLSNPHQEAGSCKENKGSATMATTEIGC